MYIPFKRVIEHGSRGPDVEAVKMGLVKAGCKNLAISRYMGKFAVAMLKEFQKDQGLAADGVYGPMTHAKLQEYFGPAARKLYMSAIVTKQLPEFFIHDHQTGGLDGYPAIDVMMKPGTVALAPADGKIHRLSGSPPSGIAKPGGPYGLSMYLIRPDGRDYFLTHFASYMIKLDQRVKKGQPLGPAVNWESASRAYNRQHPESTTVTPSHIHEGFTGAK